MGWLNRLAGLLVAPRQTFRALLHTGSGGIGDVIGLLFLAMLGTAPVDTAISILAGSRGIVVTLSRLVGQFIQFSLTPLVVTLAVGLVLAGIQRISRGRTVPLDGLLTAAVYLWVPVGVLGILGALLVELGLRQQFLPHVPLLIFLAQEPAWWAIALKLVLSYGWSAWLVWILLQVAAEPKPESPPAAPGIRWAGWALAGWLALSYVAGGIYAGVRYDEIRPVLPGDEAGEFRLPRANGQGEISLASYRGKPVVIEFWADWCSVCISHMPAIDQWAANHPAVPVLAIHQGGDLEGVQRFVESRRWTKPVFLVDRAHAVSRTYRADTLPTFFVIGPAGKVLAVRVGTPPEGWFEHQLGMDHAGHSHH